MWCRYDWIIYVKCGAFITNINLQVTTIPLFYTEKLISNFKQMLINVSRNGDFYSICLSILMINE